MVNAGRIKDYSAELVKSAPDRFSCLSKWRPRVIRSFGPCRPLARSGGSLRRSDISIFLQLGAKRKCLMHSRNDAIDFLLAKLSRLPPSVTYCGSDLDSHRAGASS